MRAKIGTLCRLNRNEPVPSLSSLSLIQNSVLLVYTIAYGPPEVVDPYEGYKVFGGVMAVMAGGIGVFVFARYKCSISLLSLALLTDECS